MSVGPDVEDLLVVFWHRGRQKFLPMTAAEIADRTGLTLPEVHARGKVMVNDRLAAREIYHEPPLRQTIYELTSLGRHQARAMLDAEMSEGRAHAA